MGQKFLKEEKAKVGRPKLAEEDFVKKAKVLIAISFLTCVVMTFSFISIMKGLSPFTYAYNITFKKLLAMSDNPNGFMVKDHYDKDYNYVMEIKIPSAVDRYSASYRYTTYYLKNNSWIKGEVKEFEKGTKLIKVKIDSKKNENTTWKIKFQLVNGSPVKESYAPFSWKFVDAKNAKDKYAYKIFTVKGYYSPVSLNEIKEAKKESDKIMVSTTRKNPRKLNLNLPYGTYDVMIKYTDVNGKDVVLAKDKSVTLKKVYEIPNFERSTRVTINIWNSNGKIDDKILSSWKLKEDKKGKVYATNYYVLKPEKSYEN